MKRDCPSLILDKTQHPFHFLFFFVCHCFHKFFNSYTLHSLFSSTISGNVSYFSAIVTFWWQMSGGGFIHIPSIFVLYLDRYCFCSWLGRSCLSISFIGYFLFKGKLSFSKELFRFLIRSFEFHCLIVPSLYSFNYFSSYCCL